jgi:hypothetical protein
MRLSIFVIIVTCQNLLFLHQRFLHQCFLCLLCLVQWTIVKGIAMILIRLDCKRMDVFQKCLKYLFKFSIILTFNKCSFSLESKTLKYRYLYVTNFSHSYYLIDFKLWFSESGKTIFGLTNLFKPKDISLQAWQSIIGLMKI